MRKKIIFGFFTLFVLLLITGCTDSPRLEEEGSLEKYLKEHYSSERFDIISHEKKNVNRSNGCKYRGTENVYIIKSLDSSIEFKVEDYCSYQTIAYGYIIEDDYLDKAKEKLLEDNSNIKMEYSYCNNCVAIRFEREKYNTKSEMANDIWNIISQLNSKYPFKNQNIYDDSLIIVKNSNNVSEEIKIGDINNLSNVNEMVDKVFY